MRECRDVGYECGMWNVECGMYLMLFGGRRVYKRVCGREEKVMRRKGEGSG